MNTHAATPLRFTFPLGVWTFCLSVVTLLASLGLTAWVAFFGVRSFLATDQGQAELLGKLGVIGLTAAAGLPGLWMCLGYVQAASQMGGSREGVGFGCSPGSITWPRLLFHFGWLSDSGGLLGWCEIRPKRKFTAISSFLQTSCTEGWVAVPEDSNPPC